MMVKEYFRKCVKFIFCVIHNYGCIGQRYDVFKSVMIVADSYKRLQDKMRSKQSCRIMDAHFKTREITPSG